MLPQFTGNTDLVPFGESNVPGATLGQEYWVQCPAGSVPPSLPIGGDTCTQFCCMTKNDFMTLRLGVTMPELWNEFAGLVIIWAVGAILCVLFYTKVRHVSR